METKVCTKCNKEFPATIEFFHTKKGGKLGLNSRCKKCQNQANAIARSNNPEYNKKYYEDNKEKIAKWCKEYYLKNKEYINQRNSIYGKKYYKKNIEKCTDYRNKWNGENPDYFKEYYIKNKEKRKKYYVKNRDKILEVKKLWRNKTDVKIRESERQKERYKSEEHRNIRLVLNQKRRSLAKEDCLLVEEWEQLKEKFNHRCAYCGEKAKLTQDHIVPLSKGGTYSKNNIIPACGRCNSSKNNKDLQEWYKEQEFYSERNLQSILKFQENI